MSEITKVIGVGLITVLLVVIVKPKKPEFSVIISIAGGLIMLYLILGPLEAVIQTFHGISDKTGINPDYIELILKVIGIAYLVSFTAEIALDAGEKALASKVEFAGKVCIFALSAPVILSLVENIISLIP